MGNQPPRIQPSIIMENHNFMENIEGVLLQTIQDLRDAKDPETRKIHSEILRNLVATMKDQVDIMDMLSEMEMFEDMFEEKFDEEK